MKAQPCPWCGLEPDVTDIGFFRLTDGVKYGAVVCCGTGPEVHTDYKPWPHWRVTAVTAWNSRAFAKNAMAKAQAEEVEKDATRYRWLKLNVINGSLGVRDGWIDGETTDWDSIIDVAIALDRPQGHREDELPSL